MIMINQHQVPTIEKILSLMLSKKAKDIELVRNAYKFSKKAHKGQKRATGEPFFIHPAIVAMYIAEVGMDAYTIAAGLLHDTVEDANISIEVIEEKFGSDVRHLVDGVTKLSIVRYRGAKRSAESLRKLFVAAAKDVRVIIIKLLDRLHNAYTFKHIPKEKNVRIAIETLEIYAPIANRLGASVIRSKLEDAAFPFAYPEEYKKTKHLFKIAGGNYIKKLDKVQKSIKEKISKHGIKNFHTETRVKGLYSFFKKLNRKGGDVNQICDILALRIIVPTIADCYTVMGIVHSGWKPMPGRIKDYITFPKPNGYQSIHTTIHTRDNYLLEIQIRTEDIHKNAQYGIISQLNTVNEECVNLNRGIEWIKCFMSARHKSHSTQNPKIVPEWIKSIVETDNTLKPDNYIETIKSDFFSHRIFVFTTNGSVIDLPIDSVAIDFAYAIHPHIGHGISTVKINGQISPIITKLHNGDIVHIITSKDTIPSHEWLTHVKTNHAKKLIKTYLVNKKISK